MDQWIIPSSGATLTNPAPWDELVSLIDEDVLAYRRCDSVLRICDAPPSAHLHPTVRYVLARGVRIDVVDEHQSDRIMKDFRAVHSEFR